MTTQSRAGHAIPSATYVAALAQCYVNVTLLSADRQDGRSTSILTEVANGNIVRADITGDGDRARHLRGNLALAISRLTYPENEGRFPAYAHPEIDKIDLLNWVDHCAGSLPHAKVMREAA